MLQVSLPCQLESIKIAKWFDQGFSCPSQKSVFCTGNEPSACIFDYNFTRPNQFFITTKAITFGKLCSCHVAPHLKGIRQWGRFRQESRESFKDGLRWIPLSRQNMMLFKQISLLMPVGEYKGFVGVSRHMQQDNDISQRSQRYRKLYFIWYFDDDEDYGTIPPEIVSFECDMTCSIIRLLTTWG